MSTIIAHRRHNFKSDIAASLALMQLLGPERVEAYCRAAGHHWRESFWSPTVTLLTFLLQAANPVKSLVVSVKFRTLGEAASPAEGGLRTREKLCRRRINFMWLG